MTLGSLGGAARVLTREEVLALPPVISLPTLGQALDVSESVIRDRARRGELEEMGIRVLRLGAQYRVVTADVWRVLGIDSDMAAGGALPAPPALATDPSPKGRDRDQRTSER
ncbi:MAG TPA: hypothetical protein VGF32_30995 [Streptosporangiaceae bacterium]